MPLIIRIISTATPELSTHTAVLLSLAIKFTRRGFLLFPALHNRRPRVPQRQRCRREGNGAEDTQTASGIMKTNESEGRTAGGGDGRWLIKNAKGPGCDERNVVWPRESRRPGRCAHPRNAKESHVVININAPCTHETTGGPPMFDGTAERHYWPEFSRYR